MKELQAAKNFDNSRFSLTVGALVSSDETNTVLSL